MIKYKMVLNLEGQRTLECMKPQETSPPLASNQGYSYRATTECSNGNFTALKAAERNILMLSYLFLWNQWLHSVVGFK